MDDDTASAPAPTPAHDGATFVHVTLLMTDLEGSTRLWEHAPGAMRVALVAHDALARSTVAAHRGAVVKTSGDGVHAAFADAADALAAAIAFQFGLARLAREHGLPLRARCGLHAGTCEARDGDYFGSVVNRAARIMAAGNGGQTLASQAVVDAAGARLPPSVRAVDLGTARLRDLARPERLYQLEHPDLPSRFAPLRSLDATPNNLPLQLTSFLGRDDELAQLRALLGATRLATVTGPGGIGKTRIALQVAADLLDRYADGAWFVDLASVADGARVAPATAEALGVREVPGATTESVLARDLASRELLVVLDNCEHVLPACAQLVVALLAAVPGLSVLATSREPLHVPGERVWPLAPLPVPAAGAAEPATAPSVRLFVERARDTRPDFAPVGAAVATIADICRRLDGIPLAIELAAARTRALSVSEIERRLADRFGLLTGGHRTVLPRQRTLEALIAWSYDLLDPEERDLFLRLAVFEGGFDLAAAEAVCAGPALAVAMLDGVDALVAKSLLAVSERDDATRYGMLETIRAFARERLDARADADSLRDRHAAWCLNLVRAANDGLRGAGQAVWSARLAAELDNVRAALAWTLARPALHDAALALAALLWRYWHLTGRMTEGRAHVDRALAATSDAGDLPARADAHYAAGALAKNQSDLPQAALHLEAAYAAFTAQRRERDAAAALGSLGNVRQDQGDLGAARTLQEDALALFRRVGDRAAEATALLNLGSIAIDQGDRVAAQRYLEDSLALAREHGLGTVECIGESNLGDLALLRDDAHAARAHFERVLALGRRIGFRVYEATALARLAAFALADGDLRAARPMMRDAIAMLDEAGAKAALLEALEGAAELCAHGGDADTAARLLVDAEAARSALYLPLPATARALRQRVRSRLPAAKAPPPHGAPVDALAGAVRLALRALSDA